MKNNRRGFTLIEVIVVSAIIAILAGILVPMIYNQLDSAKEAKALAECKTISNSILMFRKDTGKWPLYFPADCSQMYLTLETGIGGTPVNLAGDWQMGGTFETFGTILNLPAGSQSCYSGLAKQYISEDNPDPWGNKYIVNVINFSDNTSPVWVISAGPNGQMDTSVNSQKLNDQNAAGDDIGVRIK